MQKTYRQLPKSFYHQEMNRPKNMKGAVFIAKNLFDGEGPIPMEEIEVRMIDHKKKEAEEELQQLLNQLEKKNEPDNADSIGEISVTRPPIRRDPTDQDRRIPEEISKPPEAPSDHHSKLALNANRPMSKPTEALLHPDYARAASPEEAQGFPRQQPPHKAYSRRHEFAPAPHLSQAQEQALWFANQANYDPVDNDMNRRANKAFNQLNHIQFLGAARPAHDSDQERLRAVQRNMVNKQMLEEQIRERQLRKEIDRMNKKKEEEREDDRVKRENEEIDRKLRIEKEKDKEKRMKLQQEK